VTSFVEILSIHERKERKGPAVNAIAQRIAKSSFRSAPERNIQLGAKTPNIKIKVPQKMS
jgi:hypothetical protein